MALEVDGTVFSGNVTISNTVVHNHKGFGGEFIVKCVCVVRMCDSCSNVCCFVLQLGAACTSSLLTTS